MSSLLAGGLVPLLRSEGRPVAFERHPTEAGMAARLLGELVNDEAERTDDDATAFIDALAAVRRTANAPPILVVDQFDDVFRDLPGAEAARTVFGRLLAASAQRLPGFNEAPCRWLLAYRQEFHSDVVRWLRNVGGTRPDDLGFADSPQAIMGRPPGYKGLTASSREARLEPEGRPKIAWGEEERRTPGGRTPDVAVSTILPIDLSMPERFQTFVLPPLGTPTPGSNDPAADATQAFRDAIMRPLGLKNDDGTQRYPWAIEDAGAERLARAFGEARTQRPDAPLVPELQVVLAHLLDNADRSNVIDVPDDPAALIDRALEEHLRRSLDVAFPGNDGEGRLGRTRALLALRELADATGRRGSGRSAVELALAIGSEGNDVLEKLATARTRIVLLEAHDGEQIYVLSHDRMAEVLVRLFDDEGPRRRRWLVAFAALASAAALSRYVSAGVLLVLCGPLLAGQWRRGWRRGERRQVAREAELIALLLGVLCGPFLLGHLPAKLAYVDVFSGSASEGAVLAVGAPAGDSATVQWQNLKRLLSPPPRHARPGGCVHPRPVALAPAIDGPGGALWAGCRLRRPPGGGPAAATTGLIEILACLERSEPGCRVSERLCAYLKPPELVRQPTRRLGGRKP